jgi:hypothetical protein
MNSLSMGCFLLTKITQQIKLPEQVSITSCTLYDSYKGSVELISSSGRFGQILAHSAFPLFCGQHAHLQAFVFLGLVLSPKVLTLFDFAIQSV